MASTHNNNNILLLISILIFSVISDGNGLSMNHYENSCPEVETIVENVVKKAYMKDNTISAALLHMQFHDCFIRGCDGSVLLSSKGSKKAERDGPPSVTLRSFDVIHNAKQRVETLCPGVVSCADILAFATRDAIVLAGGARWEVPKGRKDGRISKASDTSTLPAPSFNISQLQHNFFLRGLSLTDVVALSGAHTLGFAHCSSFENRIRNFSSTQDIDPTMNPTFAGHLRGHCPTNKKDKNAGVRMDPSSTTFDNTYFKLIIQRKALLSSDYQLLTTTGTKRLVYKFATSKKAFSMAFVKSMIKMTSITGGQEIRRDCRVVN
ncbi:peroxidase 64-like [Euphorbia lathyris]|uniref:peroxidase 64-like n=1 Tax=Euphorbia lathyris TaxID=212925 RepID=UPI003313E9CB